MQKQQVFKVKGMQRDASMANANGEFAYEILNMRLMPAEDLSGFSLTNEKGTLATGITLQGEVIGQCPTNDSLVVFTTKITFSPGNTTSTDYIYEIWEGQGEDKTEIDWNEIKWRSKILYQGNLNFNIDYPIEALFNYETEDIQKVYWIDGINQLRCINIVASDPEKNNWNDQSFDSVKEINSLPSVEIERVAGGSFTAGVIQYYVTYFNEFLSESPIVYTSPLLYIAHDNRGANVNDQVSTAFKLTFTDLDTANWEYMRIYVTHRTSIDATPEASIVTELNMNNSTIEFTDYGSNRTSIAPTDLYFTGGKFVKAGTMTVKDQVMFLGNINIETPETVSIVEIQHLFDSIRDNEDHPFTTTTRKTKENKLEEYEDTHYYYKNQLNNTKSITHYKYGEKYRFGISVLDKYGNWSNPIWIKDALIEVPPEQVDSNTLELPCPSLDLSYSLTYNNETKTLLKHLQDRGAVDIKPLVVFPKEDERKVIAQGVVCPTVYNLKDRKENGPYAQASWFMRPNAPVDLWGIDPDVFGSSNLIISKDDAIDSIVKIDSFWHKSDIQNTSNSYATYYGITPAVNVGNSNAYKLMNDELGAAAEDRTLYREAYKAYYATLENNRWTSKTIEAMSEDERINTVTSGSWLEFRHNYALRTKGWSFGMGTISQKWGYPEEWDDTEFVTLPLYQNYGGVRSAEIDSSRYGYTVPVNRFFVSEDGNMIYQNKELSNWNVGNSAYYVDNSIVTLNSPESEMSNSISNLPLDSAQFRIIGMVCLTSTSSDISIEVENPTPDPQLGLWGTVGLHKISLSNLNIGHHGFKGMVASNAYYSYYGENSDGAKVYYGLTPLYPWQSTGTLNIMFPSNPNVNQTTLKRKILSNLRFSASTFYFNNCLDTTNLEFANIATLSGISGSTQDAIGWQPIVGSKIGLWDYKEGSSQSILKLFNTTYPVDEIVYKGNIDTIAVLTSGEGATTPLKSFIYGFGQRFNLSNISTPNDVDDMLYRPAISNTNTYYKEAKGSAIKYKSSPHFVIAFEMFEMPADNSKLIQETLPAWSGLNEEGFKSRSEFNPNMPANQRVFESEKVYPLYHQSYLTPYFNAKLNFGLPSLSSSRQTVKRVSRNLAVSGPPKPNYGWLWLGEIYRKTNPTFGGTSDWALQNNQWEIGGNLASSTIDGDKVKWTQGDTYYQRFDTLKTYAYSDSDQNSVIDITSFMVETRINIDGRTDRNRGQESNLQMSPTNFNLMNDVYSQRDNFFTYRILDKDLQARTNFPNQITWSLTKAAGATVDAWMNITLASVLDLDGTKGALTALKNFNNNIIAFQEKGLSNIMFNSRAQIATSEAVPIQIANTGKVDGQQYFTTDVGCQDKWNIVTTPNGLYFVDYFNKSIYKFNGQLEDISTPNGFRSWCYENLNSTANIIGYYDVKNKEVMYYIGNTGFMLDNDIHPDWLGFSELTGAFSSFYTYPKAWFANVQDQGLWLLSDTRSGVSVHAHQLGNYNSLLNTYTNQYGITVIPRQDSNTVKTFNNVEFRADSFDNNGYNESILPFDTISAETEYQTRTPNALTYSPYRPSNLKKKFRTWRANIPRVNNGYNRFVNQWAKIGLWKMYPSTEKTILHDLSVWYSE